MGKKHGPEEVIGKLREAEIVLAQGGLRDIALLLPVNWKQAQRHEPQEPDGCSVPARAGLSRLGGWVERWVGPT